MVFVLTVQPVAAQSSRTETIAAVVNEEAVSNSDVAARLKLVAVSSGLPNNKEIRERLVPQIIGVLIDEKLKIQEANRLEIEIPQAEIIKGFGAIAGQNNFSAEQFRSVLRKEGIPVKTLEDQIRSQIAWSRVVQKKLRSQVSIADNEVDSVIERLEENKGKSEYRVSEIFLPVEKPSEEGDIKRLSDRLVKQLVEGKVPFPRLAGQFSQAAGASKGGDLGWVQEGQLAEALDEMLAKMNEGELSKPVRSLAGFHILHLSGKRIITEETIPSRDEIMHRLGMERLDRLQRRYLLNLKTEAFIEHRV